jgi:hypothetical protein
VYDEADGDGEGRNDARNEDGGDDGDFDALNWLMAVDWGRLVDGETAVELSTDAGEWNGDTSVDSGRGIEVGDSTDGSVAETGTVVGSSEVSASPMIIDGKNKDERRASARRASSSSK